jgi:hypothetical protein
MHNIKESLLNLKLSFSEVKFDNRIWEVQISKDLENLLESCLTHTVLTDLVLTLQPLNKTKHKTDRPLTFLNFEFGAVAEYLDLLHAVCKVLANVSYKPVNVYKTVYKS